MTRQRQDILDSFFALSIPEADLQGARTILEETALEEDLTLPVFLLETNKDLFDRAMESGFRLLGAE